MAIKTDCIFCKIANGDIPSSIVYEDDKIIAFKDLNPQAPVHVLIVPREHIASMNDVNEENCEAIGYIFSKIPVVARLCGLDKGYRVISNCGRDAGQTVFHIHFHLLGGKAMDEGLI